VNNYAMMLSFAVQWQCGKNAESDKCATATGRIGLLLWGFIKRFGKQKIAF
jgi:hypothetical protein